MLEKFALEMMKMIIPVISPELKDELDVGVQKLEDKAKKTTNKFDDILVGLLKTLLSI